MLVGYFAATDDRDSKHESLKIGRLHRGALTSFLSLKERTTQKRAVRASVSRRLKLT